MIIEHKKGTQLIVHPWYKQVCCKQSGIDPNKTSELSCTPPMLLVEKNKKKDNHLVILTPVRRL